MAHIYNGIIYPFAGPTFKMRKLERIYKLLREHSRLYGQHPDEYQACVRADLVRARKHWEQKVHEENNGHWNP